MPDFVNLKPLKPQYFTADPDNQLKLTVVTVGTLYYKSTSDVTISSSDGSLTQGQSITTSRSIWVVPSVNLQVLVNYAPGIKSVSTSPKSRFNTVDVVSATAGTDTACDAGSIWVATVFIPANTTLTGIEYLVGSVGGTHKAIGILYDSSGGVVAYSALAGATVGTAAQLQQLAFTAPVGVAGPAKYYIALQFEGTTPKFRTIPAFCGARSPRIKQTGGTFGTLAALTTVPTALVADVGPIASTY